MIILLIVLIYLIGCVLSFGRNRATFYEISEQYLDFPAVEPYQLDKFEFLSAVLSWIGFIAGVWGYFEDSEKYFFKWSKKPLWKKYHENKF